MYIIIYLIHYFKFVPLFSFSFELKILEFSIEGLLLFWIIFIRILPFIYKFIIGLSSFDDKGKTVSIILFIVSFDIRADVSFSSSIGIIVWFEEFLLNMAGTVKVNEEGIVLFLVSVELIYLTVYVKMDW